MKITGSIKEIKTRTDASGDQIQTMKLEVFGDFGELQKLMKKPLQIIFEVENL